MNDDETITAEITEESELNPPTPEQEKDLKSEFEEYREQYAEKYPITEPINLDDVEEI